MWWSGRTARRRLGTMSTQGCAAALWRPRACVRPHRRQFDAGGRCMAARSGGSDDQYDARRTIASALDGGTTLPSRRERPAAAATATLRWQADELVDQRELTLSAYRNIAVNANIASTGGGDVVLRADNAGTGTGTVRSAAAMYRQRAPSRSSTIRPATIRPSMRPDTRADTDEFQRQRHRRRHAERRHAGQHRL